MYAGVNEAGASPGPTNGGATPLSTIECYVTLELKPEAANAEFRVRWSGKNGRVMSEVQKGVKRKILQIPSTGTDVLDCQIYRP